MTTQTLPHLNLYSNSSTVEGVTLSENIKQQTFSADIGPFFKIFAPSDSWDSSVLQKTINFQKFQFWKIWYIEIHLRIHFDIERMVKISIIQNKLWTISVSVALWDPENAIFILYLSEIMIFWKINIEKNCKKFDLVILKFKYL